MLYNRQSIVTTYEPINIVRAAHRWEKKIILKQDYYGVHWPLGDEAVIQHIEAKTKWPPFSRRHFEMDLLEWKCMNFYENFTEVCSLGSDSQLTSIGSDNGLVPNRRQAIIWTNDGQFYRRIYASRSLNELTFIAIIQDRYIEYFWWNCSKVSAIRPHWCLANISLGNGLVPSGTKPLPEQMLT